MPQLSPRTIQIIKTTFYMFFGGVITAQLLRSAFYHIPEDWLFFFTSDAVENVLCGLIAFGLYFFKFKMVGAWRKMGSVVLFGTILFLLALLKDYRIHEYIAFEQTFEYFTSFLGQSLLFYSGIYFVNRLEFLNRYSLLEAELALAKEQLLRNQLHPHFLFNAFNSLYSLSLKNHPDTSEYILKLSSMMRYLTDETHLERVPLHREIAFIEQYIAIEKIRFGDDARITLTTQGTITDATLIAPFMLITLVENAFKHGFYTNSPQAFVKINVSIENTQLRCVIENSRSQKQHFQERNRKGKGLENLKQRLQLLYPKRSKMEINSTEDTYSTALNITLV